MYVYHILYCLNTLNDIMILFDITAIEFNYNRDTYYVTRATLESKFIYNIQVT